MHPRQLFTCVALAAGLLAAPVLAHAAESYDNCAGFIDSVPATLATQGVWCLRHDLSTAITTGNAIVIATNNVTIDCNDFKLGGLGAGTSSTAIGIYATGRSNATVRHCNVRGFNTGVYLNGSGHLVEDNRLDNNLGTGIMTVGDNHQVRRNRIYDTGGRQGGAYAYGINADGDIIDNTVSGVFAAAVNSSVQGIFTTRDGLVRGNHVNGLAPAGTGNATGIYAPGAGVRVDGNHVSAATATPGTGIYGLGSQTFCTNNTVVNFAVAYLQCGNSLDNLP
jgi:hypothetical protein